MSFKVLTDLIDRAKKAMGTLEEPVEGPFCGPEQSFPVTDCAHVEASKAYLARSNFSQAIKKKIAASINRRAKALGCNEDKKVKAYTTYSYASLNKEAKKLYSSKVFATTRALVEGSKEA